MLMTVQSIVDTAIDLADMRNSKFIDQSGAADSELIRYANIAYRDLYNTIIQTDNQYFTINYSISIIGGTDEYSLPSDFYKLDGVDLQIDATSKRFLTLRPFMFQERNKFRSGLAFTNSPYGQVFKYLLAGSKIRFLPIPGMSGTVQLWYTPAPTVITSLANTVEVMVGGDEYLSLTIAMAMLAKEESDTSTLNGKRLEVLQQLKNVLQSRDSGAPEYITDEASLNAGALYPFRGFD
jgi:hypothetical protein